MARKNEIEIVIDADTKPAERGLKSFKKRIGGVGDIAKMAIGVGLGGALTALPGMIKNAGAALGDFIEEGARIQQTEMNFNNLARSIGASSDAMLLDLRTATRGMVSDADLMAASNKFMSMGLAGSQEEAAKLAETATQLGMAMGVDATQAMEDFALMMANQSIPRLDTFGISSGQARERINELMASTEGMTREQAFMQATMEQAGATMAKVGEQGDTLFASMAKGQATTENLKKSLSDALLPAVELVRGAFMDWVNKVLPSVQAFIEKAVAWFKEWLPGALQKAREAFDKVKEKLLEWWGVLDQRVLIPLKEAFNNFVDNVWPRWRDKIVEIWDTVKEKGKEWWGIISANILDPLKERFEEFKENTLPEWEEKFKAAFEAAKTAVKDFSENAQPTLDAMDLLFNSWITTTLPELQELWAAQNDLWGTTKKSIGPLATMFDVLTGSIYHDGKAIDLTNASVGAFQFGLSLITDTITGVTDALSLLNDMLERALWLFGQAPNLNLPEAMMASMDLFQGMFEGGTPNLAQTIGQNLARDPTAPGNTTNNNFTLNVNSMAQREDLRSDWNMFRAWAGAK